MLRGHKGSDLICALELVPIVRAGLQQTCSDRTTDNLGDISSWPFEIKIYLRNGLGKTAKTCADARVRVKQELRKRTANEILSFNLSLALFSAPKLSLLGGKTGFFCVFNSGKAFVLPKGFTMKFELIGLGGPIAKQ